MLIVITTTVIVAVLGFVCVFVYFSECMCVCLLMKGVDPTQPKLEVNGTTHVVCFRERHRSGSPRTISR